MSLSSISILPEADRILEPQARLPARASSSRSPASPPTRPCSSCAPTRRGRRFAEFLADVKRASGQVQLRQLGQLRNDARADGDAEGRGRLSHDAHSVHRRRPGGRRAARRARSTRWRAGRRRWCSRSRPASCARSRTGAISRSASLPDVPSLKQLGHPVRFAQWSALFVPAATPDDIVRKLRAAAAKAAADPTCAR